MSTSNTYVAATIAVVSDIGCPWCYIASAALARARATARRRLRSVAAFLSIRGPREGIDRVILEPSSSRRPLSPSPID